MPYVCPKTGEKASVIECREEDSGFECSRCGFSLGRNRQKAKQHLYEHASFRSSV